MQDYLTLAILGWIMTPVNFLGCYLNNKLDRRGFVIWGFTNIGWVIINLTFGVRSIPVDMAVALVFLAGALEKGVYFYLAVKGYHDWDKRGVHND